MLDRVTLQRMAVAKAADADLLLQHGRFANAYYLFGYAIELGLKARIASEFRADTIPDKQRVNAIYSHDLVKLVGLADLVRPLDIALRASVDFAANWGIVVQWSEECRYEETLESSARALRNAILSEPDGVLRWLQNNW